MAVRTFWPATLPYDGSAYLADFGLGAHEPATVAAGGSLADGSDATSVTVQGYLTGTVRTGSVVAVDFDPIPATSGLFGTALRIARHIESSSVNTARWHLYARGTSTLLAFGSLYDAAVPQSVDAIPTTPGWLTTGGDWYAILDEFMQGVRSNGLTLAFSAEANQEALANLFTVYEFGLLFDVTAGGLPPLRRFPRDDELGASSAARVWPSSSEQMSLRKIGYY